MKKYNSEFLRNPEIKRDVILFGSVSIAGIAAGVYFGFQVALYVLFLSVLLSGLHFLITFWRYQKLAKLSQDIDLILHGQANIEFGDYHEGELSVLQSELYKMVLRLKEQSNALLKDKSYLTDAIADMSHQLKTPLTSIQLILSLIEKPELTTEQRQSYVIEMKRLINRFDWLITTLLKLSKIDSGTAYFTKETVPVNDLIRLSLEPIVIPMELKEQELCMNIAEGCSYCGDMAWSVEAIGNILKNCMEHTPVGGRIFVTGKENSIYTEILIEDNGPGIAKEDLPHVFERFYKGKHSGKQSFGIGLALARRIVTEQNGTIKIENRKEGGARFILHFYK